MMKTGSGDSPGGVSRDSAEAGRSQSSEPGPGLEQKLRHTALVQTPSLRLAESPGGHVAALRLSVFICKVKITASRMKRMEVRATETPSAWRISNNRPDVTRQAGRLTRRRHLIGARLPLFP